MKRKMKLVLSVIMVLSLTAAGCSGNNDSNTSNESQQTIQDDSNAATTDEATKEAVPTLEASQENYEEDYELFVDVYDSHTARITIDGLSLLESYPRNNDELEYSERAFCWGVKLGEYEVAVIYENGRYVDTDFLPLNQEHASVIKSDSPNEIFRVPLEITDSYMIIDLTFPEEEQIDLQQLQSFTLEGMENGIVLCDREISLQEMKEQSGDFAINRIFPQEIYNDGFITGWGDAAYFTPTTEDYVLFSLGEENRENLLVSFQPDGKIASMIVRQRISTGQETTEFGLVDSKPDEETMKSNMRWYLDNGYSDASITGMGIMSVAYQEDCMYIGLDQNTIDIENDSAYADGSYISPKDKILTTKSVECSPIKYYEDGSGYQLYYASFSQVDSNQLKAPEGAELSEFDMLQYYTPVSEDYRLVQYEYGDESVKELIVVSFDSAGNVVESKDIMYFEDDDSVEKRRDIMNLGYTVHPDHPKVIIGEFQYKEPILTKTEWILSDKSGSTTVEYGGILYYSIP
jgi:hypothetical protein